MHLFLSSNVKKKETRQTRNLRILTTILRGLLYLTNNLRGL